MILADFVQGFLNRAVYTEAAAASAAAIAVKYLTHKSFLSRFRFTRSYSAFSTSFLNASSVSPSMNSSPSYVLSQQPFCRPPSLATS